MEYKLENLLGPVVFAVKPPRLRRGLAEEVLQQILQVQGGFLAYTPSYMKFITKY